MSDLLADCAAMAPLLEAFARGTKRSRLRQLVVACPAGHTLAEVFPTTNGPHVVWRQKDNYELHDGESILMGFKNVKWRAAPVRTRYVDGERYTDSHSCFCRCTDAALIDDAALLDWLASGRKRVLYNA